MIQPTASRKIPGRPSIELSEEADDEIRFQFHLLLAEKIYPTTSTLLERLLSAHKDFPVRSKNHSSATYASIRFYLSNDKKSKGIA